MKNGLDEGKWLEKNVEYDYDKGGGSMQSNLYDIQLKIIDDFEDNLLKLKQRIIELNADYSGQIEKLKGLGFMQDYTDTLQSRYVTFDAKILDLLNKIEKQKQTVSSQKEDLIRHKNIS